MAKLLLGALSILALLVLSSAMDAAPSCQTISSSLKPCISYIEGRVMASPSSACCSGVKSVASQVKGKQDLVAICNCVKSHLGNKAIPGRISDLPKKCGIPINLPPIDKNYDCSKIGTDM